ncbi:MAG: hypothetical protein ABFD81_13985 [Syntrophaceae bacterium]
MKADEKHMCEVCGKVEGVTECEHCGKHLCRECRKLEIWGTGAEDLSVKYFCPTCKDNPDVNPWGAREQEFGLGEVLEIVNQNNENREQMAA